MRACLLSVLLRHATADRARLPPLRPSKKRRAVCVPRDDDTQNELGLFRFCNLLLSDFDFLDFSRDDFHGLDAQQSEAACIRTPMRFDALRERGFDEAFLRTFKREQVRLQL
jgi:hypothetical protein